MRAGVLMQRISVMRPSAPTNVNGVPMPGDPAIVQSKIAAEVRTATGQRLERLFASSVQAQATHVVRIYAPRSWRLEHTDRLIWHDDVLGDRTLHIAGLVDPDGRHRELVIAALEQRA